MTDKAKVGMEVAKLAIDLAAGAGTSYILDNMIADVIPEKAKLPIRICTFLSNTILTGMIVDQQSKYLKQKYDILKAFIEGAEEIRNKKAEEEETVEETE